MASTFDGTHIQFVEGKSKPKTKTWEVHSKHEAILLGIVQWFGRWRKYSFFSAPDTVFEEVCLIEIAQFCIDRTKEHKNGDTISDRAETKKP